MGANAFIYKEEGTDPRKIFDTLVRDAIEENGNDSYNGTISTCNYMGIKKSFKKYDESTRDKARKYIDDDENGNKWECSVIDCGVKRWEVVSIKKRKSKSNAKYKTKYVIYNGYGKKLATKETLKEAEEAAISFAFSEKGIEISKEPVLIEGNNIVEDIYTERKSYDKKPKIKETATKKIQEIHVYYFYGWAAE